MYNLQKRVVSFLLLLLTISSVVFAQEKNEEADAGYWLNSARDLCSVGSVEYTIDQVRKYVHTEPSRLTELGTNENELRTLLINGYKSEAKSWLKFARDISKMHRVDDNVAFARKYCALANASLKDIGTSEKELEQIITRGYKSEAMYWLIAAREATGFLANGYILLCREYVAKAGITLSEIGTTEAELKKLSEKR